MLTLASPETSGAEVQAQGGTADYTLVADPNLPTITITTTSTNPDMAVHTVAVVTRVMNEVLVQRQQDLAAPRPTWLHVVPLEAASDAVNTGGKNKVLAIAAALGGLVAISLTFLAEAITVLRRRRRTPRMSTTSAPSVAGTPPQSTLRTGNGQRSTSPGATAKPTRRRR